MAYWLNYLANKSFFSTFEKFNHRYPIQHIPNDFLHTLEIGAGTGEHLHYESLSDIQLKNYHAVEIRKNILQQLQHNHPSINTLPVDCQQHLPFADDYIDRVLAIHILEHLPNLPAAIKEIYRSLNKKTGFLSVVIPCEGGMAYQCCRKISAERLFKKRYKMSYDWFINREHINQPTEIIQELLPYFSLIDKTFFPFRIPSIHLNLCIGLTLRPKLL